MEFNNYEKMGKNNYYRVLDTLIDKEQNKDRDMAAYKRLRSEGLHPPSIDGAADLETRAGNKWEVKAGHIIKEGTRKKAESQLQEILE